MRKVEVLRSLEHLDIDPFKGHLIELRRRLLKVIVAFTLFFAMAYMFSEEILGFLLLPLSSSFLNNGKGLVYTALTEGFMAYLKVAFWTALLFTAPILLYQAWAFVAPGLYGNEKGFLKKVLFWGTFLFICGASFGYFVVFPSLLDFSLGYAAQDLIPMPRIGPYVSLTVKFAFFSGLMFELPFTTALAMEAGLVERQSLIRKRKYIVIGLYALSAFLVPTDIFTQFLLFFPMWLLFEIGLSFSSFFKGSKA